MATSKVASDAGNQQTLDAALSLEIDGKSILIRDDKSFWSINRKTYDCQRNELNQLTVPTVDIENQALAEENLWSQIKSFDRFRDQDIANQTKQALGRDLATPSTESLDAKKTAILSLAALGVVYGDIGTCPLYTVQSMFSSIPINDDNIIGGISALLWIIMLTVTLKYVTVVMRVNNNGEGGVMALTALASQSTHATTSAWWKVAIMMLGKRFAIM
jgi:hypothetical protein